MAFGGILLAALALGPAPDEKAPVCAIGTVDLAAVLRRQPGVLAVSTSRRRDPDSAEPVLRHVVDYGSGAALVLEQQNCRMYNLRVTLLSPSAMPVPADLRRAGRALATTPVWKRYFARYDAAAVLEREPEMARSHAKGAAGYPLDARLSAAGERSEVTASLLRGDDYASAFRSVFSLYLGVGGE